MTGSRAALHAVRKTGKSPLTFLNVNRQPDCRNSGQRRLSLQLASDPVRASQSDAMLAVGGLVQAHSARNGTAATGTNGGFSQLLAQQWMQHSQAPGILPGKQPLPGSQLPSPTGDPSPGSADTAETTSASTLQISGPPSGPPFGPESEEAGDWQPRSSGIVRPAVEAKTAAGLSITPNSAAGSAENQKDTATAALIRPAATHAEKGHAAKNGQGSDTKMPEHKASFTDSADTRSRAESISGQATPSGEHDSATAPGCAAQGMSLLGGIGASSAGVGKAPLNERSAQNADAAKPRGIPGRAQAHPGTTGLAAAGSGADPAATDESPQASRTEAQTQSRPSFAGAISVSRMATTAGEKAEQLAVQSSAAVQTAGTLSNFQTEGMAAGTQTAIPALHSTSGAIHSAASTDSAYTAFERMDSAPGPQVLAGSPQRLAVGVRDAGLGWVEIRTHTAAGQVSAVVATGSSQAQSALSAQLPAMRDYLAEQHVHVDTLGAEQFSASSGERGNGTGRQSEDRGMRGALGQASAEPARVSAADSDEESLTYISVRV